MPLATPRLSVQYTQLRHACVEKGGLGKEVVAKGAFFLKICPSIYAAVHAVMLKQEALKKQYCEEGP